MQMPNSIGGWAFLIGALLAIISGFYEMESFGILIWIAAIIVGLTNVTEKESLGVLIAFLVLGLVGLTTFFSGAELVPQVGSQLASALTSLGGFLAMSAGAFTFIFLIRKFIAR